ncbi:hypothetical protein KBY85_10785 [Cyanobium sp. BA5m-10]|uniref:hypothetical protein n=1 Tax=Cyanobium sp. BA5m-10 TaxID=2823705 RepID=UPI0020CD73F6|nr:hypothetical protein [Cyanobium sp. BA5m-10]MCP9904615.1 hypothetical protein [Cyanobium sp. BA5m-10]
MHGPAAGATTGLDYIEVLQFRLTCLDDHAAKKAAGLFRREGLDDAQAGLGNGAAAEEAEPVLQVGVGLGLLLDRPRHHFFSWNTPT